MTTTSAPTCMSADIHGPHLRQIYCTEDLRSSATPHQQMAVASVDGPWGLLHAPVCFPEDELHETYFTAQQQIPWSPTPESATMVPHDVNYLLDSSLQDQGDQFAYHGLPGLPSASGPPELIAYPTYLTPDMEMSRPRTFPAFNSDGSPMATFGATIAPQQMYRSGPPRSEPYQFVDEFDHYNAQQPILQSIEAGSPMPHPMATPYYEHQVSSPSYHSTPCDEDGVMEDDEGYGEEKHEPYAKALFRCLRDAPENTMVLRDIYDWFKTNTSKGREQHEKGWQNSIRHNLSMNKAFEKVEMVSPEDPSKKGFQWRLSDQALRDGRVQSTTRYRNKQPNKRGPKNHQPSAQRQASGHRGGIVARHSALQRRNEQQHRISRSDPRYVSRNLRSRGVNSAESAQSISDQLDQHIQSGSPSGSTSPYEAAFGPDWQYASQHASYPLPIDGHDGFPQASREASSNISPVSPDFHWAPTADGVLYSSSEPNTEPATPHSIYSDLPLKHANYPGEAPDFL